MTVKGRNVGHKGAKVVIASHRLRESEQTVQLVKQAGSEAIFVQTDVTKATEVENLITQTASFVIGQALAVDGGFTVQ